MEEKYKQIYEQLKQETQNTLENKNSDQFVEEFKTIVKDRIKKIHEQLDAKKEALIKLALEAYNKETSNEISPEEEEIKKKILKGQKNKKEDEVDPNTFKGKVNSLIGNLESVLEKTKSLEETIKIFKDSKLTDLVEIKDGDFYFKPERKLNYMLMGKVYWDLGWALTQNKPENSNINTEDSKKLDIHANSCYNYYQTDKSFDEENSLVVFETNILKTDGYLYFGVMPEDNNCNSNCMCCTVKMVTYIKSNGYVVENGTQKNVSILKYDKFEDGDDKNIIEIRVLGKDKQVYFKVNDKEEHGPYSLPTGSKYKLTAGSCNSANGYIKILSSILVG